MKHIIVVFFTALTLFSCNAKYNKIPENQADSMKIEKASKFALAFMNKLKSGNFYEFHNEAIDAFVQKLTPEAQKEVYKEIAKKYGDFIKLEYAETWRNTKANEYEIIRLKGSFEKSIEPLEIRVVLNEANKIAGFWIKPWKENLN